VPHTVIADNAGGHLMQHGQVDLCIVGSDRVAANGDVCNKIGTYLKAWPPTTTACPSVQPYLLNHRLERGARKRHPIEHAAPAK